jgi:hypothetical protein
VQTDFLANGTTYHVFSGEPIAAPEPTTLALLGIGFAGLGFMKRRKRN